LAKVRQLDLMGGCEPFGSRHLWPLDQRYSTWTEFILEQARVLGIGTSREPIEIKVRNRYAAIVVAPRDRECRACYRRYDSERPADAPSKGRFAGAQIASQDYSIPWPQRFSEASANCLGLFRV
jgi:hypothetical protein